MNHFQVQVVCVCHEHVGAFVEGWMRSLALSEGKTGDKKHYQVYRTVRAMAAVTS